MNQEIRLRIRSRIAGWGLATIRWVGPSTKDGSDRARGTKKQFLPEPLVRERGEDLTWGLPPEAVCGAGQLARRLLIRECEQSTDGREFAVAISHGRKRALETARRISTHTIWILMILS